MLVACPHCGQQLTVPSVYAAGEPIAPPVQAIPVSSQPQIPQFNKKTAEDAAKHVKRSLETGNSWIRKYMAWSGLRSFIFQTILAGWTAFMLFIGFGTLVSASSRRDYYSDESAGAAILVGMCCPIGAYLLIAIPLGIAAIATLESNRPEK